MLCPATPPIPSRAKLSTLRVRPSCELDGIGVLLRRGQIQALAGDLEVVLWVRLCVPGRQYKISNIETKEVVRDVNH